MAMAGFDVSRRCGHRCWNWRWDLASPRILKIQVRNRHRQSFFFAHFHRTLVPPIPQSTYILNDTSLTALSLPNGDRQLFFQGSTGLIRRAVRTASNDQWTTSQTLSINSNAKNYTPLAANHVLTDSDSSDEFPSVRIIALNARLLCELSFT